MVEEQEQLQTANVLHQVAEIRDISEELEEHLDKQIAKQKQSTSRQFVHALGRGFEDEETTEKILNRLQRAKADMSLQMQLAHIGISGDMQKGSLATLPLVRQVDAMLQLALGERLQVTSLLEESQTSQGKLVHEQDLQARRHSAGSDTVPLSTTLMAKLNARDATERNEVGRAYVRNKTYNQAQQIAGNIGAVRWIAHARVEYRGDEARDESMQYLGDISEGALNAILAQRKSNLSHGPP